MDDQIRKKLKAACADAARDYTKLHPSKLLGVVSPTDNPSGEPGCGFSIQDRSSGKAVGVVYLDSVPDVVAIGTGSPSHPDEKRIPLADFKSRHVLDAMESTF